jgi:hypothetical protein
MEEAGRQQQQLPNLATLFTALMAAAQSLNIKGAMKQAKEDK